MPEATLIDTREVTLDEIDNGGRMRPVSLSAVESLAASIETVGLQQEIHLRRMKGAHLRLMAGGHRLEAFRKLGRFTIRSKIWECDDDWAKLVEIDDNLAHAQLAPLDLAVFLAERKAVYERMYPETKKDAFKGNRHTGSLASDIVSFTTSVAEQRQLSKRHIERLVSVGEALSADDILDLRRMETRTTLADLQVIAKASPDDRRIICRELGAGKAKSAGEVVKRGREVGAERKTPTDANIASIEEAWARASMAARKAFVEEHQDELRPMLLQLGVDTSAAFTSRRTPA
ncbi:MAG: ParB N-terminal domain-containing protein [Pseudomonadota bacterium]